MKIINKNECYDTPCQFYADLPAILTKFSEHAKQNTSRGSNSLAWQLMLISLPIPEDGPTNVFTSVGRPGGCALTQPGLVYTGFEVVTAVDVKITDFWDVTPCDLVHR
jgi:hypothetical protein